ncbi:MAG: hypothetical protein V8R52_00115 [Coprobacter fastidiosus]
MLFTVPLDAFRKKDFGVKHTLNEEPFMIRKLCDIFLKNGEALEADYRISSFPEVRTVIRIEQGNR